MSDRLPEDLKRIRRTRDPAVHINKNFIALNKAAWQMLGDPKWVDLLFGATSRVLAIRPANQPGHCVSRAGKGHTNRQIWASKEIAGLGLAPHQAGRSLTFPATLIEGALLVGPLPTVEAQP